MQNGTIIINEYFCQPILNFCCIHCIICIVRTQKLALTFDDSNNGIIIYNFRHTSKNVKIKPTNKWLMALNQCKESGDILFFKCLKNLHKNCVPENERKSS